MIPEFRYSELLSKRPGPQHDDAVTARQRNP